MTSPTLHTMIFSWPRYVEQARKIESVCQPYTDFLTIIHSGMVDATLTTQNWRLLPDDHYYGWKMREAVRQNKGDILLIIHADTTFYDWSALINRARILFSTLPNLGVWGPDFDYCGYPFDVVEVKKIADIGVSEVLQTDGIVTAYSREVSEQLNNLNMESNRLGWGVDWAAVAISVSLNRLVLRDWYLRVIHPEGRAYDVEEAMAQMEHFTNTLPENYREIISRFRESIYNNEKEKRRKKKSLQDKIKQNWRHLIKRI